MNMSLNTPGIVLLATLLLAVQVPAAGALRGSLGLQAAPDAPRSTSGTAAPRLMGCRATPNARSISWATPAEPARCTIR